MSLEGGSRFGDYLLERKLGQGGYGIVWAARDTKLDREIAIKILKSEQVARPQVVMRFLQEARSAAKIVHPGIVTVFECGEVSGTGTGDDGTVFIAMERLQGESLAKRLKRGKVPIELAIELCMQVASALEAAHGKGIVHRDLKPDNLMLIADSSLACGTRVKVLDFGIAKLADAEEVTNIHTSSMMMMGTPRYMSPEQCRSTAAVDHRTDVYSLGCILFELITGRTPFVGDAGEQIAKHQLEATPSTRALAPEVPKALDRLVVRMLAKKPEDRPSSMAKVVEALRALHDARGKRASTAAEDGNHASDRAITDRAATQADAPLSKGVARLEAAVREAVRVRERDGAEVPEADRTQLDATQRDGVPRFSTKDLTRDVAETGDPPRLPTDPERLTTKAQSMELLRVPWWQRRQVLFAGMGAAVVAILIGVVVSQRGGSSSLPDRAGEPPTTPPPVATVASRVPSPAARAPVAKAPAPVVTSCEAHVTAHAWDALMSCADQLADREAARAARTTAVLELRNRDNAGQLTAALAKKDHVEALMWLERIDDTSVYRDEAVTAFAAALPRPEAAIVAPPCNATKHTQAAKSKVAIGQYREALTEIDASLRCGPDPTLYRLGALAACNARNPAKARQYASRLPAPQRTTIHQICLRNGVELP